VIIDSEHVRPVTPMSWQELRYRAHRTRVGDTEIVVVVRDRDLSNAQESGEVRARTRNCDFPPLVTTATDGDNGGWFRNAADGSNFWSGFYRELAERARRAGGRHPARVHQRPHPPSRRPRMGHGRARRVEHGRPPRLGIRPMDRLGGAARCPRPGSQSSATPSAGP
jgi:hypothetical protein